MYGIGQDWFRLQARRPSFVVPWARRESRQRHGGIAIPRAVSRSCWETNWSLDQCLYAVERGGIAHPASCWTTFAADKDRLLGLGWIEAWM